MANIQTYMDRALDVLDKFGITKREDQGAQMAALLDDIVDVDEAKVTAIAKVVQYQGTFNELVRDNIEDINVSDRYNDITKAFDSIREDSKKLVGQLEDGKIDTWEKISNAWMKVRRGTPHDRFLKIFKTYKSVSEDTKEHIEKEDNIIDAYMDFRGAIKQAEILAHEVYNTQEERLSVAREKLGDAASQVLDYKGDDLAQKSRLEANRDELKRAFDEEDSKFQLIKDVAEDLTQGYAIGETLVARLQQSHSVKEQVYKRSVTFFNTNEHVFTILDAVYASQHGLHESTKTLEAMKEGAGKAIEDVADLGDELLKAGLKAGYGATINSASVQKLVDSIETFQMESLNLIDQYRKESSENSREVSQIVESAQRRIADKIVKYEASKSTQN